MNGCMGKLTYATKSFPFYFHCNVMMTFENLHSKCQCHYSHMCGEVHADIITSTKSCILKQNSLSLVICVVISLSLGWRRDHLSQQGKGDPSATPKKVILPYSTPDKGCFVFISYCLMVLSHSKLRYMR